MNPLYILLSDAVAILIWEVLTRPATVRAWTELMAVRAIWKIRRQSVKFCETEQTRREGLKAKIDGVGAIRQVGPMIELLDGWAFDCSNGALIHHIGKDGVYRYCGYTREELLEIWRRRDEFAHRDDTER